MNGLLSTTIGQTCSTLSALWDRCHCKGFTSEEDDGSYARPQCNSLRITDVC